MNSGSQRCYRGFGGTNDVPGYLQCVLYYCSTFILTSHMYRSNAYAPKIRSSTPLAGMVPV